EAPLITIKCTELSPSPGPLLLGLEPGCEYPSTVTGPVSAGSADRRAIVCTPATGMLKVIVSAPAFVLASMTAWRRDPAPESFVLMTVNVAAEAGADRRTPASAQIPPRTLRFRTTDPPFESANDLDSS